MENLKELMKTTNKLKFTRTHKKMLIASAYETLGYETYLSICMEEMAELIEVVSDNISDKVDYIHTAEEIVDVMISIEIIKVIFGIKDNELDKIDKKKVKSKNKVIFKSIATLSKSQQIISKNIRGKNDADAKIIPMLNNLNETLYDIISLFKIKRKDLDKIELLKFDRLNTRLMNGTLR